MKRVLLTVVSMLLAVGMSQTSSVAAQSSQATPDIANPFTPPNIPIPQFDVSKQYNVKDFGAVGDGKANDTPAINKAIEQCNAGGGGIVNFAAGTYQVASVHLKSNVCLKLDDNAIITGAATGYDAPEPNPNNKFQDGGHSHFHNSVMWGENIENFAIIGGYVNGGKTIQGDKRSTKKPAKGKATTKPAEVVRAPATEAATEPVVDVENEPKDVPETEDKALNPTSGDFGNKVICIANGKNLLFKGVTHTNGGHFVYLLNNCENVTIDHDVIKKSRDAIDLMGCRNVAVHDCHYTGCVDDTLGIKSDWALGKKILTENIYAWDNYFESGCNGVQFGSETAGDFRNVFVWNIKIGLAMKAGIGFTSNDGGIIDNVRFDHFEIKGAANPIFMLISNRLRSGDPDKKTGTIKNVTISNITISEMKAGRQGPIHCVTISGRPESWLENITLENIKMTLKGGEPAKEADIVPPYPKDYSPNSMKLRPASAFYIRNVKGITLRNISVNFETPDPKPPLVVSDVDGLTLDRVTVDHPADVPLLKMDNVTQVDIRDCPGMKDQKIDRVAQAKP